MKNEKSFTLIELLVVIAIIGLLASIIYVSLSGASEEAKIANSLSFEAQIYHLMGINAAGIWDFNEGVGATTAIDMSGNSNNGTINGATYKCSGSDTPGHEGCSLEFNGINSYISIPNSSIFNIQTLTICAWVNFSDNSNSFIFEKGNVNTQYSLFSHGTDIVFRTKPIGGAYDTLSTSKTNAEITNGKWHFLTATFNGKVKNLYVDGELKLTRNWDHVIETNPNGSSIGRFGGTTAGYYFTGFIDSVRIYEQALPSTEIQKLYAQGIEKYNQLATY